MTTSAGTRQALPAFIQNETEHRRQIAMWMREIHQGRFPADLSIPGTISASAINVAVLSTSSIAATNIGISGYMSAAAGQITGVFSVSSLIAAGPVNFHSTLSISGDVAITGRLSVSAFNVVGVFSFTSLAVSGSLALADTLSVSGATVLKTTLSVGGTSIFEGAATFGTTLSVSGNAVVKGNLSLGGTLAVAGTINNPQVFKAWCAFSARGVVALLQNYNVTSITDSAVGQYVINLTNAMSGSAYATVTGIENNGSVVMIANHGATGTKTSLAYKISAVNLSGLTTDPAVMCIGFMGT